MKKRAADILLPLSALVLLAVIWEIGVRLFEAPRYILPGPLDIFAVMGRKLTVLLNHTLVTLSEVALGFGLAFVLGVLTAVAVYSSRWVERILMPLVIGSQTIPVFAVAPLLILWFGYGLGSKVVMAAVIVFFPIVVNTVEGLKAADPDMLALLNILGAGPRQIFFKVRVPQSLPFVFAGARIGVAVSTIGAVIGEWVGARGGLGYLMIHANAQLDVALVFAAIFFLSVLGVGLYWLVGRLEQVLVPWRFRRARKT